MLVSVDLSLMLLFLQIIKFQEMVYKDKESFQTHL
jgi:hypothetical protein